ncbi:MAG: HIT domain-containing protein [Acidobacteria bacterium]|nr:HIT domain-containing protein [Acidobacteriota bacterium]
MDCPFCRPEADRVFHQGDLILGLWDMFPVSPRHALIVTRRHIKDWFEASFEEQMALLEGIKIARSVILAIADPAGFNIGVNVGEVAGQTIPHLHLHVIPRYEGDVSDPRGGVRHVIPGHGNYLAYEAHVATKERHSQTFPHVSEDSPVHYEHDVPRVYGSEVRPIGNRLLQDLGRARAIDIAVAFVTQSGLNRLLPHLDDLVTRGGRLRFLTGLLLRPTESKILWLQQFGRGLRLSEDKSHLSVIDYVGNHQTFLKVPMLLFPGVGDSHGEIAMALERYERGEFDLPLGCSVTYELEAIEILKRLIRIPRGVDALQTWYRAFRDRHGVRPTASESWHAGYDPKAVRRAFGSWFGFVGAQGDLSLQEQATPEATEAFLGTLVSCHI